MNCARCESLVEEHDLRCAICALPVPIAADPRPERVHAKILRCEECGAATAFSPAHAAPACAFCNATTRVEQPVDPVEEAELHIPFSVPREAAEDSMRTWLAGRGYFAPPRLRDEAVLESLHPLAWAAWSVDATAAVAWTADSDEGARRSSWAPHAGYVSMRFDGMCVPASRGLALDECLALAPHYDLAAAVPVTAGAAADETVESFDVQRSAARHLVHRAIETAARRRVATFIPGARHRNVHVACLVERQSTRRVALPAWVMAYRYRDRTYRAIVHGQRHGIVVGTSPKDWRTIGVLVASALALAIGVALLFGR